MTTLAISLCELLRLSLPEPYTWLSARPEKELSVHWVCDSPEQVQAGDLLVLHASQVIAAAIKDASQAGAAALIVVDPPQQDDPSFERLVDSLAGADRPIPCLAVYQPDSPRDVQKLFLTVLINQRAALTERGIRIHARLTQLSAEGSGLDGLVRAIASISGRGALLQDKRGGIITAHPSSTLQTIWDDIIDQWGSLKSLPEKFHDREFAALHPEHIQQEIPGGLARLVYPVVVGDRARGYLSLIGFANEIDQLDQLVLDQGSLICAVEMSRDKAIREAEKRLKGDLLTAVLQEDLTPRDARLWAQAMGLDVSKAHLALRFTWDKPNSPSRRRLETVISGEVKRLERKVLINPMGAEVICFCEVLPSRRPNTALGLAQAVIDQAKVEYPDSIVRCGVGVPVPDTNGWNRSFRQAGQALEMARRLRETRPLYFSDLSVYRLLMQIEHNPELLAFQEEIIGHLLAHEGSDELVNTLETYFQNNGNISQTAEALFLHRNTLVYRMDRIRDILQIDLDQPSSRLAVQLALNINRMMGYAGKADPPTI